MVQFHMLDLIFFNPGHFTQTEFLLRGLRILSWTGLNHGQISIDTATDSYVWQKAWKSLEILQRNKKAGKNSMEFGKPKNVTF